MEGKTKEASLLPLSKKVLTVDDVLEKIGGFGRYEIRLVMIMCYAKLFTGAQQLVAAFLAAEPPWACAVNSTVCNVTGSIYPAHTHYSLRCDIPREDWEFDTSQFNSVVSEWDLVCARSTLSTLSKSIIFAGSMLGLFIGGVLSDKFGRKNVLFYPSVLINTLGLISSFAPGFWLFVLLRGAIGISHGVSMPSAFVLLLEYLGRRHRAKANSMYYGWVLSNMLLALLAFLIRDWRSLSIAISAPGLLMVFMWPYLPRSARWLIVNGQHDRAVEMLSQVAKVNRKQMPEQSITSVVSKQRVGDVRELFQFLPIARKTIVCCFCWIATIMMYYGVHFGAGSFGGNRYLVFFLVSIVELPSIEAAIRIMDRFGRRKTVIGGLLATAFFSMCAVLLQRNTSDKGFLAGRIIMSMIAKFSISVASSALSIFNGEIFPTVVRSVALGTASGVGRIGVISAPFVVWLVRIHVLLPYSIFAGVVFVAAILCCTLPETKDEPTPEVFDEKALSVDAQTEERNTTAVTKLVT